MLEYWGRKATKPKKNSEEEKIYLEDLERRKPTNVHRVLKRPEGN